MARETVEQIIKRGASAWKVHAQWESVMSEAFRYGMPQRNGYDTQTQGAKKGIEVFDSTATVSTRRFSNKMVNLLFPPFRNWTKLEAGPGVPDDQKDEVNEALQKAQAVLFTVIHNMSAFQTSIGEFALDLAAGTGIMLAQKGTVAEPIIYETVPEREVALELGPRGRIGGKFRRGTIKARNLMGQWPDAKLSDEVKTTISDEPDKEYQYEEVTYTDQDGAIYYDVLLPKLKARIVERDMDRDPWIATRFMRASGEVKGRGPLLDALADIKTINKLVELILKNASLTVAPIYTGVDDQVMNTATIQLVPGEIITVARNAGHPSGPSLAALERAGDFNVGQIEYARLQDAIKAAMFDQELPPMTGQPRTAAEILERVRRLVEDLGATYGRIVTELIVPIMQISLDILSEWGLIEPIRIDGIGVQLTVTSPLAALQNLEDVENVVRALELSKAMFGDQMTALTYKVEEIPTWTARKLGVPEELIRDEDERKELEGNVAEIMANLEAAQPGAGLQQLAAAATPARVAPQPVAA